MRANGAGRQSDKGGVEGAHSAPYKAPSLPAGGGEAGREGVGGVRVRPEGALTTAPLWYLFQRELETPKEAANGQ